MTMQGSALPEGYKELDKFFPAGMSNSDGTIDDGFAEALRSGRVCGRHAAWNFNGCVWYDPETLEFVEEVWVYQAPRRIFRAETLEQLMTIVNNEFGYE